MSVTHVQGGENDTASTVSTLAVTLGATVGFGNGILGGVGWVSGGGVTVSIADDKGNTYPVVDSQTDGPASYTMSTFALIEIVNGPITITATFSPATDFVALALDEYSGITKTSDGHTGQLQSGVSGTDAVTSGNITTTADGDLIYGVTIGVVNGVLATAGTGFTGRQSAGTGANVSITTEDKIQGSHGSVAATFTAGSSDDFLTGILTFTAGDILMSQICL